VKAKITSLVIVSLLLSQAAMAKVVPDAVEGDKTPAGERLLTATTFIDLTSDAIKKNCPWLQTTTRNSVKSVASRVASNEVKIYKARTSIDAKNTKVDESIDKTKAKELERLTASTDRLTSRAQTDVQKTAIASYKTDVTALIETKSTSLSSALEGYTTSVKTILQTAETQNDTNWTTYVNAVKDAQSAAKTACESATTESSVSRDVKTNFVSALSAAAKAYTSAAKGLGSTMSDDSKQSRTSFNDAVKAAKSTYKNSLKTETETLKSSISTVSSESSNDASGGIRRTDDGGGTTDSLLVVVVPNGGEVWYQKEIKSVVIKTVLDLNKYVMKAVVLKKDGTGFQIFKKDPAVREFSWTVGKYDLDSGSSAYLPDGSYKMQVCLASVVTSDMICDISDNVFRVVTSPTSGGSIYDLNGNGVVDADDMEKMVSYLGSASAPIEIDFNKDGKVDIADARLLWAQLSAGERNKYYDAAFNGNGVVDYQDMESIVEFVTLATSNGKYDLRVDFNLDGAINRSDAKIIWDLLSTTERNKYYDAAFNGNGVVEQNDVDNLSGFISLNKYDLRLDFNLDGAVNSLDLTIMKSACSSCSTTVSYTITATAIGGGKIISSPLGINCGYGSTDCSKSFTYGTGVTLTGKPISSDYAFGGWTGCPNPAGSICTINVNNNYNVTATFIQQAATAPAIQ
jgi:hypothetical protein